MHLEKFEVDQIQNDRLSAIIHLGRPDIVEYHVPLKISTPLL